MRAIEMSQPGGPDVLKVREVLTPEVGEGEVLVQVQAAGVNYLDTYHRSGAYRVDLPFVPGQEGAGVIEKLGPGVSGWSVGDRVGWAMCPRSYAEYVALPANRLAAIPDGISTEIAAASLLQGLTAHYLVTSVYPIEPGSTALVHAAAGGVGLLLTQMIKARGGVVIGTTSSDEKVAIAQAAGADHMIRYDTQDWVAEVARLTSGRGVDVAYDGVGKTTFDGSLASLRPRGVLALYGASSGPVAPFDLQRLNNSGSLVVTRPSLTHFISDPDEFRWRVDELFGSIANHTLEIRVAARFDFDHAADAHRAIESREYSGKIVLIP